MSQKYTASVSPEDGTIKLTLAPAGAFVRVSIKLVGTHDDFPECHDDMCPLTRECANHRTAGDFRLEGGITPTLRLVDGMWECQQNPNAPTNGAIMVDGRLINDLY